jgi:hypothetical protein
MQSSVHEPLNSPATSSSRINRLVDIVEATAGVKLGRRYKLDARRASGGATATTSAVTGPGGRRLPKGSQPTLTAAEETPTSMTGPGDVLCLGAHCDDLEIGCGGTLAELARRYPRARFHSFASSSPG